MDKKLLPYFIPDIHYWSGRESEAKGGPRAASILGEGGRGCDGKWQMHRCCSLSTCGLGAAQSRKHQQRAGESEGWLTPHPWEEREAHTSRSAGKLVKP